jgi:RNA ligase (TIGR02306 family)
MEMSVQESQLHQQMVDETTVNAQIGLMPPSGLATIERIIDVLPIENSDNLELVKLKGWQSVVLKGEFKKDQLVVYVGLDSIVPKTPTFEFMRKHKFRVKTCKLRGALSQGLVFSLSILPLDLPDGFVGPPEEGYDATAVLGITKYEKYIPATMGGCKVKGNFPPYVPKTDQERIQNVSRVLEELKDVPVYITIKLDGTSATYVVKDGEFKFCSRNLEKKRPEEVPGEEQKKDIYWDQAVKYGLEAKMLDIHNNPDFSWLGKDFAIQGEIVGDGVQHNPLGLKTQDFFVFDIYDITNAQYLNVTNMRAVITYLGLKSVPVVSIDRPLYRSAEQSNLASVLVPDISYKIKMANFETGEVVTGKEEVGVSVDSLLKLAEGNYEGTSGPREGIVIRPMEEVFSPAMKGRLTFKVVNNTYLLKNKE